MPSSPLRRAANGYFASVLPKYAALNTGGVAASALGGGEAATVGGSAVARATGGSTLWLGVAAESVTARTSLDSARISSDGLAIGITRGDDGDDNVDGVLTGNGWGRDDGGDEGNVGAGSARGDGDGSGDFNVGGINTTAKADPGGEYVTDQPGAKVSTTICAAILNNKPHCTRRIAVDEYPNCMLFKSVITTISTKCYATPHGAHCSLL